MYEFVEITKNQPSQPMLASDEMMIGGRYVSETISGYQQLQVSGRGILSRSVKREEIPRRSGSWFSYAQDKERILEVAFKLEAGCSEELRERYDTLNRLLRYGGQPLPLSFRDEPEYTYYGYLEDGGSEFEKALTLIDKFTIVCPDPYKYKATKFSEGSVESEDYMKLLTIIGTVKADAKDLTITNGRETIRLKGNFSSGDRLMIKFRDEVTLTLNNNNALQMVDLGSDLENFILKSGDRITSPQLELIYEWREYRL